MGFWPLTPNPHSGRECVWGREGTDIHGNKGQGTVYVPLSSATDPVMTVYHNNGSKRSRVFNIRSSWNIYKLYKMILKLNICLLSHPSFLVISWFALYMGFYHLGF